jgi:polar amino acid transport system permease protein
VGGIIDMRTFGISEFGFLIAGFRWTVLLSLIAFSGGIFLGFLIALARISNFKILRYISMSYIQIFQGTPLLIQLFIAYYGFSVLLNLKIDAWTAVSLAFTFYAAAYLGEIWRGAIQSIPYQQWETSQCLSLSYFSQLRFVILPQAFRIAIPPTVGFLVQLIKGTSVASIIGFVELTRAGQLMTNVTFQPMTIFPIVAILYFIICFPLSRYGKKLERGFDVTRGITQGM